jgi:hypothetical protein
MIAAARAALARLEQAGIGPQPVPRAAAASAGEVARRGRLILASLGIEPSDEVEALPGSLAAALPEVAAGPGMHLLVRAIAQRDPVLARRAARSLAGLGPGLTPAGDDLLAGAAATVAGLGEAVGLNGLAWSAWLAALTGPEARARTTALSAKLLELAALGTVLRPVLPLLDLGPAGDRELGAAVADLRGLGHSTGRAYGLAVGATAWLLGGSPGPVRRVPQQTGAPK